MGLRGHGPASGWPWVLHERAVRGSMCQPDPVSWQQPIHVGLDAARDALPHAAQTVHGGVCAARRELETLSGEIERGECPTRPPRGS
jgi:hypothetical protein